MPLGPAKQRTVLAALVADLGRPVRLTTLINRVWAEPPQAAREVIYAHIARLRRTLRAAGCGEDVAPRLSRVPAGYLMEADRQCVDIHRFHQLVGTARDAGTPREQRAATLREALGLWTGTPLADLTGEWVAGVRDAWEQQRLAAAAAWARLEFDLGRPETAIDDLSGLLTQYPLAEAVAAELIRALDATGRRAEALDWYTRIRDRLVRELGVEPGADLRELQVAILRGSRPPAGDRVRQRGRTAPAQLPADVPGFVGRAECLTELDGHLAAARSGPGAAIIAVTGTAGVGKTALAVHWAHRVGGQFPDGQLHVNLHGFDPAGEPVEPRDVLGQFLRVLGVPPQDVPAEVEEAAGLYRSLMSTRRVLVLLDNARSAAQVRPLVPPAAGCLLLVTSRNRLRGLTALDGARRLALDALTPAEATAMMAGIVGADRVSAETQAATALAEVCAHLPLTLRIAATMLADSPGQPLDEYVEALRHGDRLTALALDDDQPSSLRATLDLSYRALTPRARRMLRLLGLPPGPDVTVAAAAALAGTPTTDARQGLDELVAMHLLDQPAPGRYTFHDLLRLYARQRAQAEEPARERVSAMERLYEYYLYTADSAARLLYPQSLRLPLPEPETGGPVTSFADHTQGLAWLDAEHANLIALARAGASGPQRLAVLLADTIRSYLNMRRYMPEWFAVAEAGLAAAAAQADLRGQAAAHISLGQAQFLTGHGTRAVIHLSRALMLCESEGWADGRLNALNGLGIVFLGRGDTDRATHHFRRALDLLRRDGSPLGMAVIQSNLGDTYRQMGQLRRSISYLTEGLPNYRKGNSPSGLALLLATIGGTYLDLGDLDRALDNLESALEFHRKAGDRRGAAFALVDLSGIHRERGRHAQAIDDARTALGMAEEVGDRSTIAMAHNALAATHARVGRHRDALGHYDLAVRAARRAEWRFPEVVALVGQAGASRGAGDLDAAQARAEEALGLARSHRYRHIEGQALIALAAAHLARGRHDQALALSREALTVLAGTDHPLGIARALLTLGRALETSNPVAASGCRAAALAIFGRVGADLDPEYRRPAGNPVG